ncbi:MAG TPA: hypothetical protein PLZ55_13560, partial [bacterium]|nr:hypothetical protein [bacterium]
MKIWRISIRPTSLQLTPWQADTLFGTLCWAFRFRHGENELKNFLEPFLKGEPPFLISDGIPTGYFPAPLFVQLLRTRDCADVEGYRRQKQLKRVSFLPETEFTKACRGESIQVEEEGMNLIRPASQLHASINRLTGTTSSAMEDSGGNLFELHGWGTGHENQEISLYLADRTGDQVGVIFDLLRDIEATGFGKKKSSGMGAFKIQGEPETWEPPSLNGKANGFVSLSGFVPARNNPTNGFWQIQVKHGKLGEAYATGGFPFKYPWIVLQPGSCFYIEEAPGEIYGRMLCDISPEYPEVVQYAYAFPIPVIFPGEIIEKAS